MTADESDEPAAEAGPEDTFALVGNEIRAGILRALGEARGREGAPPVLPFSELRERVDVDVRSSQFNYHLQQLVGQFVERVPAEEAGEDAPDGGYRMRPEGTTLYRVVRSGTFDRRDASERFPVGQDCHFCGAGIEAAYDDGLFTLRCPDCDYRYEASTRVPPGALDDEAAALDALDQYDRHKLLAFSRGVCPTCVSRLDTGLVAPDDSGFGHTDRRTVLVHASCPECGNQDYRTVGETLLYHPAVVSFFDAHGVDVTTTPKWELAFAATDRHTTVESSDPWRVALDVEHGGDTLELVVDGDCDVVERRVV